MPIVLDDPKHIAHLRTEVHPILLRRAGKRATPIGMIHHNLQGWIGRKQRLCYRVGQSGLDAMLPILLGGLAVEQGDGHYLFRRAAPKADRVDSQARGHRNRKPPRSQRVRIDVGDVVGQLPFAASGGRHRLLADIVQFAAVASVVQHIQLLRLRRPYRQRKERKHYCKNISFHSIEREGTSQLDARRVATFPRFLSTIVN